MNNETKRKCYLHFLVKNTHRFSDNTQLEMPLKAKLFDQLGLNQLTSCDRLSECHHLSDWIYQQSHLHAEELLKFGINPNNYESSLELLSVLLDEVGFELKATEDTDQFGNEIFELTDTMLPERAAITLHVERTNNQIQQQKA